MLKWLADSWCYFTQGPVALLQKRIDADVAEELYIYGAGEMGRQLFDAMEEKHQQRLQGFFDRYAEYQDTEIEGVKVYVPKMISDLTRGTIVVASEAYKKEIVEDLQPIIGDKPIRLITL